jgi:hypothetical protein
MDDFGVPEQAVSPKILYCWEPRTDLSFNDELGIVNSKLRQKQELVVENRGINRENRYKNIYKTGHRYKNS